MWPLPDVIHGPDGSVRRVGVEIELQGIKVAELARLTASVLDGDVNEVTVANYEIDVPDAEPFRVEVDFALLKELASTSGGEEHRMLESFVVDVLGAASSVVVPCEIVTPPLPMDAMGEPLDRLVKAIREAGGKGTRQMPWYAFGLHLNLELPDIDAATVCRYMQAYVCASDWIIWKGEIDLARRITPFIDAWPPEYELLLSAPGYAPDWATLVDDYLKHNPTRNRAMDMLPMFAHVDEDRVRDTVDDGLVKARPALHYRLENSCVDESGWTIEQPWRRWLSVERLAQDEAALRECCAAFRKSRQRPLQSLDNRWRKEADKWLADPSSL